MKAMPVGTKVVTIMGCHREGVIVRPFCYRDSNDGTYRPPNKDELPVQWNDGTKGYHNRYYMKEVS